jgi:hypothetical protein
LRDDREDLRTSLDQAANDLWKIIYFSHTQSQNLLLKTKVLGESFDLLYGGGANTRDSDFNFRLSGLPRAHLIHADDAAIADKGYAVAALLNFAK